MTAHSEHISIGPSLSYDSLLTRMTRIMTHIAHNTTRMTHHAVERHAGLEDHRLTADEAQADARVEHVRHAVARLVEALEELVHARHHLDLGAVDPGDAGDEVLHREPELVRPGHLNGRKIH